MRVVAATVLATALVFASTAASAQSRGYGSGYPDGYSDRYGYPAGAQYDYARVIRVDPVFDGYRSQAASGQPRCRTREETWAGGYGDDGYRDDGYRNDGRYDGYDPYGRDPYARDRRDDNGRMVATVVGGVVGAVLGSKVGGGSGRYATSAIGTMVGGMAGREIYDASQRGRDARPGRVTVCDPVPVGYPVGGGRGDRYGGVQAYDVTYEYAGRRYTTRTDHHPGDTIRVRVDVRPD